MASKQRLVGFDRPNVPAWVTACPRPAVSGGPKLQKVSPDVALRTSRPSPVARSRAHASTGVHRKLANEQQAPPAGEP